MSVTYLKDLYRSSFTRGGVSSMRDQATIIGLVGLTGTDRDKRASLELACDVARAARGPYHPDDATLPLRDASARAMGVDTVEVRLSYWREKTDRDGVNPFVRARVSDGLISVERWRLTGTVQADYANGTYNWQRYRQQVPVSIIQLDTTLGFSPDALIWPKLNTVNGDTVTFNGQTYGTAELRYDGHAEQFDVNDGTVARYNISYRFTARPGRWLDYIPGTTDLETNELNYGTAVFGGTAFPVTT
jgi:hypothetical protein